MKRIKNKPARAGLFLVMLAAMAATQSGQHGQISGFLSGVFGETSSG